MRFGKKLAVLAVAGMVATLVASGTAFAETPTPPGNNGMQGSFGSQILRQLGIAGGRAQGHGTPMDLDQAVKDGKLTQAQADEMKSHQGTPPTDNGNGGPRGNDADIVKLSVDPTTLADAIASSLSTTTAEIDKQLQAGKTLADVASGSEDTVRDAIQGVIEPIADQAVSDGKITSDQEDAIMDKIDGLDLSAITAHRAPDQNGQAPGQNGQTPGQSGQNPGQGGQRGIPTPGAGR